MWAKAVHGKFCVKLTFDKIPDKPKEDREWPRE